VNVDELPAFIRDIPDFPKPGVVFKDITPLLADVDAFRTTIDAIAVHFEGRPVDRVLGIEARGFIAAAPVAYRFGAAFVPVRKAGKPRGRSNGSSTSSNTAPICSRSIATRSIRGITC